MSDERSIVIRCEGPMIVIEDVEATKDYAGPLKTAYLSADAAIRLFSGGLALAQKLKNDQNSP